MPHVRFSDAFGGMGSRQVVNLVSTVDQAMKYGLMYLPIPGA